MGYGGVDHRQKFLLSLYFVEQDFVGDINDLHEGAWRSELLLDLADFDLDMLELCLLVVIHQTYFENFVCKEFRLLLNQVLEAKELAA